MDKSLGSALQAVSEAAERASRDLIMAAGRDALPSATSAPDLGVTVPKLSPIGTTPENTPKYTVFFDGGRAAQYAANDLPKGTRFLDTCPPLANRRVIAYHTIYKRTDDEQLIRVTGYDNPQRIGSGGQCVFTKLSSVDAESDMYMKDIGHGYLYRCDVLYHAEVDNYLNLYFPDLGLYIILNIMELPAAVLVFMASILPTSSNRHHIFRGRHMVNSDIEALKDLDSIDKRGTTIRHILNYMVPGGWETVFSRAKHLAAAITPALPAAEAAASPDQTTEAREEAQRKRALALSEDVAALRKLLDNVNTENIGLRQAVAAAERDIADLGESHAKTAAELIAERDEARGAADVFKAAIASRSEAHSDLVKTAQEAHEREVQKLQSLASEVPQLRAQLAAAHARSAGLARTEKQYAEANAECQKLRAQLDSQKDRSQQLTQLVRQARDERDEALASLRRESVLLEQEQVANSQSGGVIAGLRLDLARAEERLARITQEMDNETADAFARALSQELDEARRARDAERQKAEALASRLEDLERRNARMCSALAALAAGNE